MKPNRTQCNDLCLLSGPYNPTAQPPPIILEGNELTGRAKNKGIKEGKTAVVIYLICFALVGRIEYWVTKIVHLHRHQSPNRNACDLLGSITCREEGGRAFRGTRNQTCSRQSTKYRGICLRVWVSCVQLYLCCTGAAVLRVNDGNGDLIRVGKGRKRTRLHPCAPRKWTTSARRSVAAPRRRR